MDRHILTGVIRCGRCGTAMQGLVRAGRGAYADGKPVRHYRCPSPNQSIGRTGCGHNALDALLAEQAVIEAVTIRLRDPARAELVADQMREARSHRPIRNQHCRRPVPRPATTDISSNRR